MNMTEALKALMGKVVTHPGPRLDRQTVDDTGKDNRLDELPSIYEDQSYYDEETDQVYPDKQTFIDLLDPVKFEGGQNMPQGRPQDYAKSDPRYRAPGPHGFSPVTPEDVGDDMYQPAQSGLPPELLEMITSQMGIDPAQLMAAMRGRDLSADDLGNTLNSGADFGPGNPDANAFVERALADKVMQMMSAGGVTGQGGAGQSSTKYQGKIGDKGSRARSGKGEQKVRRKLKGQADKGDRE